MKVFMIYYNSSNNKLAILITKKVIQMLTPNNHFPSVPPVIPTRNAVRGVLNSNVNN